jgi:hypothetical protein
MLGDVVSVLVSVAQGGAQGQTGRGLSFGWLLTPILYPPTGRESRELRGGEVQL